MKKLFLLIGFLFIVIACSKVNDNFEPEDSTNVTEFVNYQRFSSALSMSDLIRESELILTHVPDSSDVTYKEYETPQSYFDNISENNFQLQTLVAYTNSIGDYVGYGAYFYSSLDGNLNFNVYYDLNNLNQNRPDYNLTLS